MADEFSRKDISSLISSDVFSSTRPITTANSKTNKDKLKTKGQEKQKSKSKRVYRPTSNKLKNYHLLAMNDDEDEEGDDDDDKEDKHESEDENDKNSGFVLSSNNNRKKRVKKEAVIIQKKKIDQIIMKKNVNEPLALKRRKYDDSDDDDQSSPELDGNDKVTIGKDKVNAPDKSSSSDEDDSDDDSSSGSSSDDSSSESSSSEEEIVQIKKPLFIPKSKRDKITSVEEIEKKYELEKEEKKEQTKRRKLESRALVAQVISIENDKNNALQKEQEKFTNEEDYGGATNIKPKDKDNENEKDIDYQNWTVRELLRILQVYDDEHIKQKQHDEYLKRRLMTDDEIMQLQQQEKTDKTESTEERKYNSQRYYHRGAYYMDEDTLKSNPNDIRNKAKDYAQSATSDDILITDTKNMNLPVKQNNKHFGFSRYSTKYKGLSKEDTTDKNLNFIPHVSSIKKK